NPVACGTAGVFDEQEILCDSNQRDLSIEFSLDVVPTPPLSSKLPGLDHFTLARRRYDNRWMMQHRWSSDEGQHRLEATNLTVNNADIADLAALLPELDRLFKSVYVGAFRSAISEGGANDYYDLTVGDRFVTNWNFYKTGSSKENNRLTLSVTEDIRRIFGF